MVLIRRIAVIDAVNGLVGSAVNVLIARRAAFFTARFSLLADVFEVRTFIGIDKPQSHPGHRRCGVGERICFLGAQVFEGKFGIDREIQRFGDLHDVLFYLFA